MTDMKQNAGGLSAGLLNELRDSVSQDRAVTIAANASVRKGFLEAAASYRALQKLPFSFSIDLKQGSVTDQKHSGRCWLFAALNTFRYEVIRNMNLEDFELSQNYLFFYDKLERANYYLENMIRIAGEPADGRLFSFLNRAPLEDGGQWDMMANLVRKYGVVPKSAYPDGANSVQSRDFDQYLGSLLREYGVQLREMCRCGASEDDLRLRREEMMKTVYRCLVIALGEPPRTFDLTLRDKNGKVTQEFGIDGRTFFEKYVRLDLDGYVSVINAPTADKPFGKMYTVSYLGNVSEGRPVSYLNLPIEDLKAAVIAQLRDGHPVWFGSDCMKFSLRSDAVFDRAACDVETLCGIAFNFTKADRLVYGDSAMDHAMVLLGVNLNGEGRSDRWHIENSWGKESGPNGGHYTASDSWFDEFVYQAAVHRRYLPAETAALLGQEPAVLQPWDPMGTLAR